MPRSSVAKAPLLARLRQKSGKERVFYYAPNPRAHTAPYSTKRYYARETQDPHRSAQRQRENAPKQEGNGGPDGEQRSYLGRRGP